jgi:hypothetical protein
MNYDQSRCYQVEASNHPGEDDDLALVKRFPLRPLVRLFLDAITPK